MSILVLLILVSPTLVLTGIITFDVIDAFIGQEINKMFKLEFQKLNGWLIGWQATGKNEHGYEYSVVQHRMSYGGTQGQYEFAGYDSDGKMVHHSVTGWLTREAATEMAKNWKG